jgi:carbonic anhydrase
MGAQRPTSTVARDGPTKAAPPSDENRECLQCGSVPIGDIVAFSDIVRGSVKHVGCLTSSCRCVHRSQRDASGFALIPGLDALARLREGNHRFVLGIRKQGGVITRAQRGAFVSGQQPFAVILGCSDSRVPVEIVFDQGMGDLFVIRVAGNIVAPSQIGSVEFAAERFGTRLVVVLGHTRCGAIEATVEALQPTTNEPSRNVSDIIDRIRPSVEGLLSTDVARDRETFMRHAVRANVRMSANHLRHGSEVLERLIDEEELLVVGAEYSLETGVVDFFDGVPDER